LGERGRRQWCNRQQDEDSASRDAEHVDASNSGVGRRRPHLPADLRNTDRP
jgi:hypothetical protein